jgi:PKD repeat protein
MKVWTSNAVMLTMLCLGLLSCGGGGGAKGLLEFSGDPDRFTLKVLDESGLGEALAGEFTLQRSSEGEDVILEVLAEDALDLRAFYFEIEYNPGRYSPQSAKRSMLLGTVGVLELAVLDRPGRLSHGQIIARPDEHSGFSGDGTLASLRFERQPMQESRSAAQAPSDLASQSMPLFDPLSGELSWLYRNTGDYDQNGEVNIADLTPLGKNFGTIAGEGGFDDTESLSVIDGDGNGQINIADITPIGIGFGRSASGGYRIYRSADVADYPEDPLGENGSGSELLSTLPFTESLGVSTVDRLAFSYVVEDPQNFGFYWVRPTDTAGAEGYASSMVSPPDDTLPVLSLPAPPQIGSGTTADPYEMIPGTQLQFMLVDADGNDVTADPLSIFTVNPEEAGVFTAQTGLLTVGLEFEGPFSVSAGYDGLSAAQVIRCKSNPGGPVAVLTANKQFGPAPLSIVFSGSQSSAPGGSGFIVEYSFDWEDDGVFDDIGTSSSKSHVFTETGVKRIRLRVTDNNNRTGEATLLVESYLPNGPNASLSGTPLAGKEPLLVNFDASGSTPKSGNPIDHYEFDFNDDFDFSDVSSSSGLTSHVFEVAGLYPVRVKVFDGTGLFSIAERKVTVNVNTPPTAVLELSPASPYYVPSTISFNATKSTDPDGGIVGYSYDFDGDGSFDYEGTDTLREFEYTEAGSFTAMLQVQDIGGKTDMATVEINVFVDDRPMADLQADVTSGLTPLTVNFDATGSVDPENMLTAYEWDLNGDGNYTDLVETTGIVQFVYVSAGTYNASVQVRDADDNTAVATQPIVVTLNKSPTADLRADKLSGFTPIDIELDASHSSDPDGTIVSYEWETDDDDDFDDGFGNVDTILLSWVDSGGIFPIKVRVTDDKGLSAVDELTLTVFFNEPPVADLQADSVSGFRPLIVDFDASGSFDPDGTVVAYRFDFDYNALDGPQFDQSGLDSTPTHVFDVAKLFQVYLEVEDDGGKTSSEILEIDVQLNLDPVADMHSDGMSFDTAAPVDINFWASGSFDPDLGDTIVNVDYDFDGDGSYEFSGVDIDEVVPYAGWSLPGMYMATLRVTDNHGAAGYASIPISVSGGQAPPSVTMTSSVYEGEAPLGIYVDADGTDSNGVIAKYEFDFDGALNGWNWQESGKADKATGRYDTPGMYEAWVRVTDDDGAYGLYKLNIVVDDLFLSVILDNTVSGSDWMDAAIINGKPAVAYASGTSQLRFVRANDAAGTSWAAPIIINNDKCTRISLIELDGNRAGISYYDASNGMKFLRATSSANTDFTAPQIAVGSVDNKDMRMVRLFDKHPAVAYFIGSNLKFKRCDDINGDLPTSWPVDGITIDTTASTPMDMAIVHVYPAIVYRNTFAMSTQVDGSLWPDLFDTGVNGGAYYSLIDNSSNNPRFVHDRAGYNLSGSDDQGATWTIAEVIDPLTTSGKFCSMMISDSTFWTEHSRTISAGTFTIPISRSMLLDVSTDLTGTAWEERYGLDTLADQGIGAAVLEVDGLPAVAYRGTHNGIARILKWQVQKP